MVTACKYHEQTKHTPERVRTNTFSLDFENKPRPYKIYEDISQISLGESLQSLDKPALAAIATSSPEPRLDADPPSLDAQSLQTLCHYATGVTKTLKRRGRKMRFRAAACTGKLYHVDLYAVIGAVDGLDPGVYHFDPDTESFDVLRVGDYRGVLAQATDDFSAVANAPMTFVATSQWWRNAWKYRNRTYRHAFWDSGTILATLLAVASALGHESSVVAGFADEPVVRLLGIDPEEEAPLELVPVGSGSPAPDAQDIEQIDPDEVPLSDHVVAYPLVFDAWRQSTLGDNEAVRAWRQQFTEVDDHAFGTHDRGDGRLVTLDPVDTSTASSRPVTTTIERRGSLREYSHDAISDRKVATILDRALRGVPTDCGEAASHLVDYYCLVHAVEGIPSGAYQYHPEATVLERLGETSRQTAGHLALDQSVVGEAAVNVYIMADVDSIVEQVGNRGYRLAQLLGGISLGRLYLATYAHRTLGGRGFTFYDDLVSEHLSPRAANQTPMTLFAFGKRVE
ncbi:SagB-type dehydrogenase domain protein [Halogeometricum borinquense DSM 11551]|uniref:SagB-type dehydrogenase domain n=1 Tax=Halogeometricum borinquense (strain ATCC 700274 / DSM 11551 / JCM 10706 / KCTC 4070 / PR3) TaxID=469382 RepID=E4NW62_HALBP|nr:SagB family peptide dehydrogenase [Halogeometricum borinquense]ADQ69282.1 SagB-type dehydrogenase domain [Halogeometricum borinquense DSM 11551]ELY31766.1 SagB-type dehydrogenase domain protein [Halogeometricum borinquense DSM 11551]